MNKDKTLALSPVPARLLGLCLFLLLGMAVEWLVFQYRQEQVAGLQTQTATHGEKVRARLEGELNAVLALSQGLAGYWAVRRDFPDPGESSGILADHYRRSRYVRSFAVTAGSRIVQVFPQDDDKQPIGLDYRQLPQQWSQIQRAVEARAPLLEGPFPPGLAMTYRVPVWLDGQFQGLVSTLIDGSSLLAAAGFAHAEYQYALKTLSQPGAEGKTLFGADGLFNDPQAALATIAVSGGEWQLAVKAKTSRDASVSPGLARVLGWLFAALFAAQSAALLNLNRKLSALALYDRLTGLPSRHLFLDRLRQLIRRTKRNRGNFSVLFVNLNDFNTVNSAHGEKVGDMMLAGIGKRLISAIRHCDTVTRWVGDEFVILLDACPSDQAKLIVENLRHKIELPVSYGGSELRIGAAIGLATFPDDGHSLAALLKVAGNRMRNDKTHRKGRPDFRLYGPTPADG